MPDHEAHVDRRGPREFFAAVGGVSHERTLVMPVLRVQTPRDPGPDPDRFVTDVQMREYSRAFRRRRPGPQTPAQLAAEHFPGAAEYRVAVVAADDRVLFESAPGAAADATDPDLITTFLQPRLGW